MASFKELLTLIVNGDPVDEGSINRILRDLDGNTRYLRDLLLESLTGSTVFARSVTVESDAAVGMPVYYNATSQQFERGLASAYTDSTTGQLLTAASSQIWGIVHTKINSTNADILLTGYAQTDLALAVDGTVEAGLYYLSGVTAGKLVQQQPPVSVTVLQADGEGNVYVNPNFSDIFTDHQHYMFPLLTAPAGDFNDSGTIITIPTPNSAIEGWLPASDAVFSGNAPAGAAFGYNLSQSVLDNVWPPLPIASAYLEWNNNGGGFVGVPTDLVLLDNNGIWWMGDCTGDVPFDEITSSSWSGDCPRGSQLEVRVWFTKMQFQTAKTVVTSLRSANSILTVRCINDGDDTSTTGDLELDLDLSLIVTDETDSTHIVFKDIDSDGNISAGPVVSGIRVSGDATAVSTDQSGGLHRGTVTISLVNAALGGELPISLVELNNTTEENYEGTLGMGFPAGKDSDYRGKFVVPAAISGATSLTLRLRAQVLAKTAGNLPDLEFSYRVVNRPGTVPGDSLPVVDTGPATISGISTMGVDEYVEIESGDITAVPGDYVLFTLARTAAGGGDGYASEVHVLDQRAVITGVTP